MSPFSLFLLPLLLSLRLQLLQLDRVRLATQYVQLVVARAQLQNSLVHHPAPRVEYEVL